MADPKYTQRVREATEAFELLSDEWEDEVYRIAKERDYTDDAADFYTYQTRQDYSAGLIIGASQNVEVQALSHLLWRLADGLAEAENKIGELEEKLATNA